MKLESFSPDHIRTCYDAIRATEPRPLIVGITGEACAGKTYFSALLCGHFDTEVTANVYFSYDDFLISRADRELLREKSYTEGPFAGRSHWEVLENWYRLDEFDSAIETLKAGKPFTFFPYQRSKGTVSSEAITLQPAPYILVDTGMALEKMDFLILVSADADVILERKRQRGVYRSWDEIVEIHERVQAFHWSRVKPLHADIEITNNGHATTT